MDKIMNKTFIILLFGGILLNSCSHKVKEQLTFNTVIPTHSISHIPINEVIEEVVFLPLESTNENILKKIDKVYLLDDRIYLGDFSTNKITVFDSKGEHLYTIDKTGQGPGEYIGVESFTVDEKYVYIVDNWRGKLLIYNNHNGAYVDEMLLPIVAWDIEKLNNDKFIFTYIPQRGGRLKQSQPPYRLFVTDEELNIEYQLFEYAENESDPLGQKRYFTINDRDIVWGSFMFDGFSLINKNNPSDTEHVKIDFENGLARQKVVDVNELSNCQYIIEAPFLCGQFVYMLIQESGRIKRYLYHLNNHELYANSKETAANFLLPIIGTDGNRMIACLSDYDYYNKLVKAGFRADEQVEQTLRAEGMVLLFYTFKE